MQTLDEEVRLHRELQATGPRKRSSILSVLRTSVVSIGALVALAAATSFLVPSLRQETVVAASSAQTASEKKPIDPIAASGIRVYATALLPAPGAIVCRDYNTVLAVYEQYAERWRDQLREKITKGQSRLIQGGISDVEPAMYGCLMVPAGTTMMLEPNNVVPVVSVANKDGTVVKGVTLPSMIQQAK